GTPQGQALLRAEDARLAMLKSARQAAVEYVAGVVSVSAGTVAALLSSSSTAEDPPRPIPALIRASAAGGDAIDGFAAMVMQASRAPRLPEAVKELPVDVLGAATTTLRRALKAGRLVQLVDLSGDDLRSLALLQSGAVNESGFLDFNTLPVAA